MSTSVSLQVIAMLYVATHVHIFVCIVMAATEVLLSYTNIIYNASVTTDQPINLNKQTLQL